jgi:hypothetical protein
MKGLGAREVAEILGVSIRSIRDVRWRARVRLPARRIGRRLIFTLEDCQRLLRRNVERFPDRRGEGAGEDVGGQG